MADVTKLYDPTLDMWPDLRRGRIVLKPVRIGVDRRTGKLITGWNHVEQSICVIFSTRYHTRVLRRWCGSFVPHLLGQSMVDRTITRFYWAIGTALDLWEPNFGLQRVRVATRSDGSLLSSPEDIRRGNLQTQNEGIYRPRAHLGDPTPETRKVIGLIGRGFGAWDRAP